MNLRNICEVETTDAELTNASKRKALDQINNVKEKISKKKRDHLGMFTDKGNKCQKLKDNEINQISNNVSIYN